MAHTGTTRGHWCEHLSMYSWYCFLVCQKDLGMAWNWWCLCGYGYLKTAAVGTKRTPLAAGTWLVGWVEPSAGSLPYLWWPLGTGQVHTLGRGLEHRYSDITPSGRIVVNSIIDTMQARIVEKHFLCFLANICWQFWTNKGEYTSFVFYKNE